MVSPNRKQRGRRQIAAILLIGVVWWTAFPILSTSFQWVSILYAQEHRQEGSQPGHGGGGGLKETIFKWVNLGVLAGALVFFLRKPLQEFLEGRAGGIKRSLEEAKSARENAERELAIVHSKLNRLEQEVASLRAAAAAEAEAEQKRILDAARGEARLIVSSAHDEVSQLIRRAQKELREYAAAIVIQLADQKIRSEIRSENHRTLFRQFVDSMKTMEKSR